MSSYTKIRDWGLPNTIITVISVVILAVAHVLGNEETGQQQPMNEELKVDQQISEFKETENIEELGNIIASVNQLGGATQRLKSYIKILEIGQKLYDSKFNFKEQISLNIAPPEGAGRSGVEPEEIKDPQLRAKYERDLAENAFKIERVRLQNILHKSLSRIQTEIKVLLTNECRDGNIDKPDKVLEQNGASPETIKNILGTIPQDNTPGKQEDGQDS